MGVCVIHYSDVYVYMNHYFQEETSKVFWYFVVTLVFYLSPVPSQTLFIYLFLSKK